MAERLLTLVLVAVLASCTSAEPESSDAPASPTATGTPPISPTASASSASATPSASAASASPSAPPPPSVDAEGLEVLDLEVTGCPGGVALEWSPTTRPEFHHYTALRSLEPDVKTAYPPIAPAVDWGRSYGTDRFVTSAVDASLIPSEAFFFYRVMGYDERNRPVAASPARRTRPTEVVDLGPLTVDAGSDGATRIDWGRFGGLGSCFSASRVLIGPGGADPSATLSVISSQQVTELETTGLHAGETYAVRIDAVRTTTLGAFVVARSETVTYTVP